MPKQLQITIPEPCHENWAEMTPTQQGAYCKVCSKNVIDFTTKTENEIYDILTQSDGNTCGRFTSFQLQQPIRKTEINNGWFNWRALAASLAALLAFEETQAQQNKENDTICLPKAKIDYITSNEFKDIAQGLVGPTEPSQKNTKVLSGKVIDADTKEPLYGATVYCKSDKTVYSVTDESGEFKMSVDSSLYKNDTIIIQCLGFTNREIPVADFPQKYNGSALEIQMSQAVLGGFDIVVVSPVKMGKFKKAHMRRMERKNNKGH